MTPTDADKDLPLREDTRLLGRLLGDVLRAQTGEPGYARIEAIRQTAVRFRRAVLDDAPGVKLELHGLLNDLPIAQTLDIVRAFSYFSHLVNIAEDVHQNRRRRSHALAGSPPQRGSIADALDCVAKEGVDGSRIEAWFADALISPVLTAHPTEVQRKSILDCEREVARLLQWRDRGALTADEAEEFETGLYRQVLALWQTAMIRLVKLKVEDEIENGLAYYRYTFLAEVPKFYLALAAKVRAKFDLDHDVALPPFLRLGSWIGGDRDGNPLVNSATLSYAIDRQATVAFGHYLGEVHGLGAELSLSTRLVTPSTELLALAAAAGDTNPHRDDEPYRQALIGVYARLTATAAALSRYVPARAPHADLPPYASTDELLADLRVIEASLALHGATKLAEGRLVPLIRAVEVFGFHLAVLDLRQNSDVHEAVIAELFASAGVVADYAALAGIRANRPAAKRAREPAPPPLAAPHLFRPGAFRAGGARGRREHPSPLRRGGAAELRDLEMPVGVRPPRSRDPAEGSRPAARRVARGEHRSALRDDRRSRALGHDHARGVRPPVLPPLARRPRRLAGGDARLFRQQQGRRLPHRQLVAVSSGVGARRRVPRPRRQAAALPRPRRHRRPRRRAELRGDPRATRRQRERRPAHHRARRDHREQILRSRSRPAQSRDARRRHARGEPRRR